VLRHLSIRDFVIVEALDLDFEAGFTVFTGETGAGKSILIDALALALGGRGDAGVVRAGAERAEVSAQFDAPALPAFVRWLGDNEFDAEDDACLLRRTIDAAGRSRAWINGRAATAQQLRAAAEFLIDIHGQHAHQSLLRADVQRDLLDGYGGHVGLAGETAAAWRAWRDAAAARRQWETGSEALSHERALLDAEHRDLVRLEFTAERWAEAQAEHTRLTHARSLVEGVGASVDGLSEGEDSALSRLAALAHRLDELAGYDARLSDVVVMIQTARVDLQEAGYALRSYARGIEEDPDRLAELDGFLERVHGTARRHRLAIDDIPQRIAALGARLAELETLGSGEELERREVAAREAYLAIAGRLRDARAASAKKLSAAVTAAMRMLAMADGRFEVALVPYDEGQASGLEQVEFRVSAHAALAAGSLAKVASGGELARISLALQVVLSKLAGVPTLIFDEVDTGIGGGVAEVVGQLLGRLATERQVMCVTHLPQVAACAQHHFNVAKSTRRGVPTSRLSRLDEAGRVEEIARMLGGVEITDTTRRHAAEMLGRRVTDAPG
jgi:DNA repair protein RecN (Recombination protein N)